MRRYQGSYTVEATAIFGITITIIFLMVLLGFEVYQNSVEDINAYEYDNEKTVDWFRRISLGKELLEEVKP